MTRSGSFGRPSVHAAAASALVDERPLNLLSVRWKRSTDETLRMDVDAKDDARRALLEADRISPVDNGSARNRLARRLSTDRVRVAAREAQTFDRGRPFQNGSLGFAGRDAKGQLVWKGIRRQMDTSHCAYTSTATGVTTFFKVADSIGSPIACYLLRNRQSEIASADQLLNRAIVASSVRTSTGQYLNVARF